MMSFSRSLRRLRVEQFFSQAELARRAGLHALTVTRLEAGKTAPTTRSLRALADALGVELRDLATPEEVADLRRTLSPVRPLHRDATDHASRPPGDAGQVQPPNVTETDNG